MTNNSNEDFKEKSPRYLSVIFCGGEARRFGDVKALGYIGGAPLLEHLINAVDQDYVYRDDSPKPIYDIPVLISLGSKLKSINKKNLPRFLYTEEIIDFLNYKLDKSNINLGWTNDSSKASCIKNLAEIITGNFKSQLKFRDFINNKYTKKYSEPIDTNNIGTADPTFLLKFMDFNSVDRGNFTDYIANRAIVALNGDSIASHGKIGRSPTGYRNRIYHLCCALPKNNKAAIIGLFPTTTRKGREYEISKGNVVHISKKDRNVNTEAGYFIFNPNSLADITIPKSVKQLGLNWLCQKLIDSGKEVLAVNENLQLFDLNEPQDYFELRKISHYGDINLINVHHNLFRKYYGK